MMNAKEALISSNLHRNNTIENHIYDACRVGKTNAHVRPKLTTKETNKLSRLGYVVSHSKEHSFSTIWWDEKVTLGNLNVVKDVS